MLPYDESQAFPQITNGCIDWRICSANLYVPLMNMLSLYLMLIPWCCNGNNAKDNTWEKIIDFCFSLTVFVRHKKLITAYTSWQTRHETLIFSFATIPLWSRTPNGKYFVRKKHKHTDYIYIRIKLLLWFDNIHGVSSLGLAKYKC